MVPKNAIGSGLIAAGLGTALYNLPGAIKELKNTYTPGNNPAYIYSNQRDKENAAEAAYRAELDNEYNSLLKTKYPKLYTARQDINNWDDEFDWILSSKQHRMQNPRTLQYFDMPNFNSRVVRVNPKVSKGDLIKKYNDLKANYKTKGKDAEKDYAALNAKLDAYIKAKNQRLEPYRKASEDQNMRAFKKLVTIPAGGMLATLGGMIRTV